MNNQLLNDVKNIIELVNSTKFADFELKCEDYELRIKKMQEGDKKMIAHPAVDYEPKLVIQEAETDILTSATVKSPLVGQFYLQQDPKDDPLIEVGMAVKEGDVLCVIECMKIMNEIKSNHNGIIKNIYVENGDAVEFGQKLIEIA